ncbi:MAG: hypothetical protein IJW46_05220, partial [Clostridia bacterium]|nr:hypothetical protein [Clostridia bacterium]
NGEDITSTNTPEHPDDIRITESEITVGASSFSYTFPAHSFVAIKLTGEVSDFYTETLSEDFDLSEISTLPDAFSLSGTASIASAEEGKMLRLARSTSNSSLTVSLAEDATPLDGITRIRFRLSAEQMTRARIQVDLNRSQGATMMFAMEEGFVKNDAKIRAVYTEDKLHEFEIVVDNRSGQYILYFDGGYIGSPGKFDPDTGLESITFTTMTESGTFALDDIQVLSASTEVSDTPVTPDPPVTDTTPDTTVGKTPDTTPATPITTGGETPDTTPVTPVTTVAETPDTTPDPAPTPEPEPKDSPIGLIIGIVAAVILVGGGVAVWVILQKKRR